MAPMDFVQIQLQEENTPLTANKGEHYYFQAKAIPGGVYRTFYSLPSVWR